MQDARSAELQGKFTSDSFQNFVAALGMGTDNIMSASTYGFNPITRIRTLLEWIHRGSWLGGVAIDLVAEDMTRMGVELKGDIEPEQIAAIDEAATAFGTWNHICDTEKWARLYGGGLAVLLIDGQDPSKPLRIETVGKGQYKGLLVLDRWMCEPSLNNLITELGPYLGMPTYYRITAEAPALVGAKVHFSRCLRLEGIRLPYWQRIQENLWGISVLERLYDRMVAFDSATQGAAQLVYKSYLRTYSVENLRELIAAGGKALDKLVGMIQFMRSTQSNEGITLIDAKDKFETFQTSAFSGLNDALMQFGQQLAGALQIPLVRLFGQSPAGFSTGETDLRSYYDSINQRQNSQLKVPVTTIYRCIAQSEGIALDEGFAIAFRPLWQLTEEQKGTVATSTTDAIMKPHEAGLISDQTALRELKQASQISGVFTNITREEIEAASDVPVPKVSEVTGEAGGGEGEGEAEEPGPGGEKRGKEKRGPGDSRPKARTSDGATRPILKAYKWHGLDVAIENPAGSTRVGIDNDGRRFSSRMYHDYGFIDGTVGADGDAVDAFVGPNTSSDLVFVVHTMRAPDFTQYDEDKCFLDFSSEAEAKSAFMMNYDDPHHFGSLETFTIPEFLRQIMELKVRPGSISRKMGKLRKQDVGYTDHAMNPDEMCTDCVHFSSDPELGGTCQRVFGAINPGGWCTLFSRKLVRIAAD
ncbi:MAG TPA: anti-CBASS Acb1 family protein [Candidatus Binatia bacterium]|nr:anti-CBASS Acb1 family protein [Candidatus Binatia bacterium]